MQIRKETTNRRKRDGERLTNKMEGDILYEKPGQNEEKKKIKRKK